MGRWTGLSKRGLGFVAAHGSDAEWKAIRSIRRSGSRLKRLVRGRGGVANCLPGRAVRLVHFRPTAIATIKMTAAAVLDLGTKASSNLATSVASTDGHW